VVPKDGIFIYFFIYIYIYECLFKGYLIYINISLVDTLSSCMQSWMYLAVPVLVYAGERALRFIRSASHPVCLLEVNNFY
jgi:hypothetical protein